jgi:putative IMPACT (imprinted ancient) family translation regulator
MNTLKQSTRGPKITIKKSLFICTGYIIASRKEAEKRLAAIHEEFSKATHNVYAYRVGFPVEWEESSDDGEVRGCAGKPIMDLLQRRNLTNVLLIVTRIYGGVKLGPGRLIRSYVNVAKDLLDVVGTKPIVAR